MQHEIPMMPEAGLWVPCCMETRDSRFSLLGIAVTTGCSRRSENSDRREGEGSALAGSYREVSPCLVAWWRLAENAERLPV